jgi:hypothetical protein
MMQRLQRSLDPKSKWRPSIFQERGYSSDGLADQEEQKIDVVLEN